MAAPAALRYVLFVVIYWTIASQGAQQGQIHVDSSLSFDTLAQCQAAATHVQTATVSSDQHIATTCVNAYPPQR